MRIVHAGVVLLAAAAVARAQLKVETLPAPSGAAATFAVDIRDASQAEAIAAFEKQTGIAVVFDDSNANENAGGPAVVYDVVFAGLGRSAAIKELGRALSLGVNNNIRNGPARLSRNSWSNDEDGGDKPAVRLESISRQQSFPPSPQMPNTLGVQFRVSPGRGAMVSGVRMEVTEAIDDRGRKLEVQNRGGSPLGDSLADGSPVGITVALVVPAPAPTKLAVLRGQAMLMRAKTITRITADKLADVAVEGPYEGGTISIGPAAPVRGDENRLEFPVTITRGGMEQEKWNVIQRQAFGGVQTAELRGEKGERLWLTSGGGSSNGQSVTVRARVTRNPDRSEPAGAPPKPVSFKWDLVAETVGEPLAFELSDVVLP